MKSKIWVSLVFGLAASLMLLAVQGATQKRDYPERKEIHQTYDLAKNALVEVDTIAGSVVIETSETRVAEVNAILSSPTRADLDCNRITIEQSAQGLRINGLSTCSITRGTQQVLIRLPIQTNLGLRMIAGSVKVAALDGVLRLDSIAGPADVGRVASAEISSLAQGLKLELSEVRAPGIRISSVTGEIDFRVSDNLNAELFVSSLVGLIENDTAARALAKTRDSDYRFRFGGGGNSIEVSSVRGAIRIHRLPTM